MFTLIPLLSFELSFVYTWTDSILHSFPFKSSFISILLLFSLPILWFSLIFFLNSLNPLSVLSMCMVLESSTREWRAYKEKNQEISSCPATTICQKLSQLRVVFHEPLSYLLWAFWLASYSGLIYL